MPRLLFPIVLSIIHSMGTKNIKHGRQDATLAYLAPDTEPIRWLLLMDNTTREIVVQKLDVADNLLWVSIGLHVIP